jgi:hypothetical protein
LSEYDYSEENILLAGQISNKNPIFKMIAQMDKESGFAYHFIELIETLKQKTPKQKIMEILKLNGQVNFMNNCGELSKLAAVMGDSRQRSTMKGIRDELTTRINNSSNP